MRHDVHSAALAAASRVAFSILLAGCAGAQSEAADDPTAAQNDEAELRKKKTSCHEDAAAKPSCDDVLASAFGDAGGWPNGDSSKVATEVKTCCVELLESEASTNKRTPNHWRCCGATNWGAEADAGIACTPWGPPVPPAMKAVA